MHGAIAEGERLAPRQKTHKGHSVAQPLETVILIRHYHRIARH